MRAPQLWLACLLASAAPGVASGQDASAPVYQPLFSPEMIEQASPEQATRMRATEQRNRQAWDERQEAIRQREQAAQRTQQAEQSAPQPRTKKNKIYKWVDKDGRVHFGDAPAGQGAQEIEVKGIAREQGNPPPPPGATGGERN
jgi:hypothetical protein